jgi:peptide/nickel transport system substrate-binding protein/oligopeptide transport system substrate-binding protein
VINLVFAGLVRLDGNLEVQPDGAESWQVSDDGRVYTFKIRRNLRFGNGDPVTAHDFLYAINRALTPTTGSFSAPAQLSHIIGALDVAEGRAETARGVRVLDDYTLEIELDAPQAFFLAQLTYPYTFVTPRQLIEQAGDNWVEQAYGTGPYLVEEWRRGTEIVLTANPHYWRGSPGIATIRLPFYATNEEAYQRYRNGELDIAGSGQTGIPAERVNEVKHLPDFRSSPALSVRYIGFNNQLPPFNNASVRKAFALAVDKQDLTANVLSETVIATNRILPQGLIGSRLAVRGQDFDPTGARSALNQAGYLGGHELPPVTFTYALEGDNSQVAQALYRYWRDHLGVEVTLEGLELQQFIQRLDETFYEPAQGLQMYLSVWSADYPDPQNFLSQQLHSASPNNNGHWANTAFDRLVDQADQMSHSHQHDERLKLYNQAEQIALDEVGWLPLYNPSITVLVRSTIQGLDFTPQGLVASNWTKVWMVRSTETAETAPAAMGTE